MHKKLKEQMFSIVKQLNNPNVKRLFDNLVFEKQSVFDNKYPTTSRMLNQNKYFWGIGFRLKNSSETNTIFIRDDKEAMLRVSGTDHDHSLLFHSSDIKRGLAFAVLKSICRQYNVTF